jgi:hypothetical protein
VIDGQIIARVAQSVLSIYATVYILSAVGLPSFYLRYLSVDELSERKASKWRVWLQGAFTVIAVGVLVYAAAYAIIAAIPYSWGYHDEDDEWYALRDSVRFMLTFFGAISLALGLDQVARALVFAKIEKATRAALLRAFSESYEPTPDAIQSAIDAVRRDLKIDDYAQSNWATEQRKKLERSVVSELEEAKRRKEARRW